MTTTTTTSTTMTVESKKALVAYLESTILGYDKLNIRKQCGTLTPRQEARLVSLENMIRSICVVCEANGLTLTDTSGYPVAMMNWSEGTRVFYGSHYADLLKDAVRFTDLESVDKYKLSLVINAESTETLIGKIWIETKELVQLSWVFVKDSASHVWAIMRDGSKYLWGKLCDLFVWLMSLLKKETIPATTPTTAPVAPTAAVIEGTVV